MHSRPLTLLLLVLGLVLVDNYVSAATQDPWQVLGVRRSATRNEITRAFRKLSREWHPDKNRSPEATQKFQEISAAYDVLTDPKKAKTLWEATDDNTPGSGFSATFGTVQFVLDLDPSRLLELVTTWTSDWAGKNWNTFGPLWHSPVDHSVCWCLENAWRLPRLTEPVSKLVADFKGTKHVEGAWRAWRLSGALLELSAWISQQSPCLYRHMASSNSSEEEVLAQLHQLLQTRRKARKEAVASLQRRQRRQQKHSKAKVDSNAHDASDVTTEPDSASVQLSTWQGRVLWGVVLVVAVGFAFSSERMLLAPLGAACLALYCTRTGLLLPNEAAVQQLGRILDAGGLQASMVGTAFVLFCLVVGLLAPLLIAAGSFVAITWVWAAASCLSITLTPALSQFGLAMWMVLKAYLMTGGDKIKGVLLLLLAAGGFWKAPKLFKWWASLAFAPAILVLTFIREVLRASGLWWPTAKAAPNAPAEPHLQQPPTAAAPQPAPTAGAPATAAGTTEQTDPLVPQQHQQLQQQQEVIGQPAGRAAAILQEAAAARSPGAAGTRSSSSSRSSSSRKRQKGKRLLPDGAWWPRSFGPVDLAVTCHWYTSLLGWHLARWALGVAAVSCRLTVVAVLFAVTAAAYGAPVQLLTLRYTVQLLLLRAGPAAGLLWKLWAVLQQQVSPV